MPEIAYSPATWAEASGIALRMRYEDITEAQDLGGLSPSEAIKAALKASTCAYVAYIGSTPEVVFGVGPTGTLGVGHPWLLATDKMATVPKDFLKASYVFIEKFLLLYPILTNIVDKRNTLHISWLNHMGFQFIHEYPEVGPGRVPGLQFAKIRK